MSEREKPDAWLITLPGGQDAWAETDWEKVRPYAEPPGHHSVEPLYLAPPALIREREEEAVEWLNGSRSMTNLIPRDPFDTWSVRIAQADAAMVQQAYWTLRAHREGLLATRALEEG